MHEKFKSHFKLLNSSHGRMKSILLVYPGGFPGVTPTDVIDFFGEIMSKIGGEVVFYVLANFLDDNDQKAFEHGLLALEEKESSYANASPVGVCPFHIVHLPADFKEDGVKGCNHSQWVQDPFSVLHSEIGLTALLEPYAFGRKGDRNIAEQVASKTGMVIKPTSYELEGGNILGGDSFVMIGKDLLFRNLAHRGFDTSLFSEMGYTALCQNEEFKKAKAALESDFREMFGMKYVIWIGLENPLATKIQKIPIKEGWQPLYHIDLFLTLGDFNKDGTQTLYVAELPTFEMPWIRGNPTSMKDIRLLLESLDEVADQLQNLAINGAGPRFTVKRTPMILDFETRGPEICIVRSYNNCLVEISHQVKKIFLPSYVAPSERSEQGSSADEIAAASFGEDFHIVFIDESFVDHSAHNAALHCLAKVLYREHFRF